MGAKITGSKTTKAKEAESLKAARTKHRVGIGQLFAQPTAHADRENAKKVLEEALEMEANGDLEAPALAFVKNAAPVSPAAPAARPAGTWVFEHRGWKVLVGGAMVSEAQAKWIIDIAERPSVTAEMKASLATRLEQGFAKYAGSQFITNYKDTPKAERVSAAKAEAIAPGASTEEIERSEEVPAGRYAIRTDGVVKFYKLDRPTEGRWAGYVFLKVQASDDMYPIRNRVERDRIIAEIGKDTLAAEQLYGQELGKCSRCGRTLTDETSRAYGIGPDCRNK